MHSLLINFKQSCAEECIEKFPFASFKLTSSPLEIAQQSTLEKIENLEAIQAFPFPSEILLRIFEHLSFKDIRSVSTVCRQWNVLMEDNQLWHHYLKKAELICKSEQYDPSQNYKEIFQFYAIPSLLVFDQLNDTHKTDAKAISADGKTVAGYLQNGKGGQAAFIFTEKRGFELLNSLNDGTRGCAYALSADGKIAVGFISTYQNPCRAFKWTKENGMQFLPHLKNNQASTAVSISADGKVIGGNLWNIVVNKTQQAVIWFDEEKPLLLNTFEPRIASHVKSISGDGKTILGDIVLTPRQIRKIFKWTREEGLKILEELGSTLNDDPLSLSYDGEVIAVFRGDNLYSSNKRSFLWSPEKSFRHLGRLKQGYSTKVSAMTPDCKTAIGNAHIGTGIKEMSTIFRWTRDTLLQPLSQLFPLENNPLTRNGFSPRKATSISWNGIVMIGEGSYYHKDYGKYYGYRLVVPKKDYF